MKILTILRFELSYQLRSVITWLYFGVVAILSYLFLIGNYLHDARDGYFLVTAPIVIAACSILANLFWLPIGASIAGDAAARDVQSRMYSLTYTSPLTKAEYLGGRFLAALLINLMIMLAIPLGVLCGMYLSGIEPEIMGPFRLAAYLNPVVFIILPNTFLATAVQFACAVLSRKAVAAYAAGIILFIFSYTMGTAAYKSVPWGYLVDPMSFSRVMSRLTLEWSPLEQNTRLLDLDGALLANRMLWFAVAMLALGAAYFRFRFSMPQSELKRKPDSENSSDARTSGKLSSGTAQSLPKHTGSFDFATHFQQLHLIVWKTFRQIAFAKTGIPFLGIVAMVLILVIANNMEARGVPVLLRTDFVLDYITAPLTEIKSVWLLIVMLLIYYAGELVWRDREAGISDITGAAPVSEWVLFLGKFLAMALMLIIWLFFLMIAGITVQLLAGETSPDLILYLQVLFGLQLVECLLFALLVLFIQVLVNQKFIAHLLALLVFAFMAFPSQLYIEHKLLVYGASPAWSYTNMAGYGTSLAPWFWFKIYWLAWAVLLAVIAKMLLVRGREGSLLSRIRLAPRRISAATRLLAISSIAGILLFGGFIFYNTNVLNDYTTAAEVSDRGAAYEKRFGKYKYYPQPLLSRSTLRAELYPTQHRAEIQGTHYLLNTTPAAIDSIHVALPWGVQTTRLDFSRGAKRVLSDDDLGFQIYVLDCPLQPGDTLELSFRVQSKSRGFTNQGADAAILANGTSIRNYDWLPAIGYQSYREIDDVSQRKVKGLPARPATASLYDVQARKDAPFSERIQVEAVVGTDASQTALGPGSLRRSWTENGRRYFHYATDALIRNEYNFFSAKYAIHKGSWKNVAIEIFYDPGQTENLERMLKAVKASMEYYSREFGPYPHKQIRFVSYPGNGFGNHASPINITAQEGFFLLNPKNDERGFDLVTAVVAHEVAHQWWGGKLSPARVEGAGLLSESLAWYSAMGVLEKGYSPDAFDKLLSFLREENKIPRTRAAKPLLQAADFYQNYRKGPFVLYALTQYLGSGQVNSSLRNLLAKHGSNTGLMPTSLDLYHEMKAVTPDSLKGLLSDYFERNTFWKLATKTAVAKKTKAGLWEVTLNIEAEKFTVDSAGNEKKYPVDTWVEVGVYPAVKKGEKAAGPLYLKKHYLRSGQETIKITVPDKPVRAGVDPRNLLIDWEPDDNMSAIK